VIIVKCRSARFSLVTCALSIDQRRYLLLKNRQLLNLVFYRSYKDALNTDGFVPREFFRADLRRADEKPLAELINGPI